MEINATLIKELRQAKGWTQQHFADASGLSLRTIQRVEREGSAAKETALALCATLDIELKQLSIIPVVEASQLQETNRYKPLLPIIAALLLGALGGGLVTYWAVG